MTTTRSLLGYGLVKKQAKKFYEFLCSCCCYNSLDLFDNIESCLGISLITKFHASYIIIIILFMPITQLALSVNKETKIK